MLQDEYLKVLVTVYFLSEGNITHPIVSSGIAQKLSISDEDAVNKIMYLDGKGYVEGKFLFEEEAMAKLTPKGIDYIENPYDSLRKDEGLIVSQENNLNISNIGSQGAAINIFDSSIILRNTLELNNDERSEINCKLDQIKDILDKSAISNENLNQIMGGIKESLKKSDRVVAAQKLSLFQKIVSKVKDFQVLLQCTLSTYEIFKIIFHL